MNSFKSIKTQPFLGYKESIMTNFFKSYILLYTVLLLMSFSNEAFAQHQKSKIDGAIENAAYEYAFLYVSSRKALYKSKVVEGKFEFSINKEKDFELGILYLANDSVTTYEEVTKNSLEGLKRTKLIALDSNVYIDITEDLLQSKMVGGVYTKQLNEMNEVSKTQNFEYFFKNYNKSPISLLFLKTLVKAGKISRLANKLNYDFASYYYLLSDELKSSKEGLEVKLLLSMP